MPAEPPRGAGGAGVITRQGDNYLFANIPYQGRIIPAVELSGALLDNRLKKTQAQWAEWSIQNPDGWNVADAELLYQCLLRAYTLRDDATHKPVVQDFTSTMQGLLDPQKPYLNTLTKVNCKQGLEAVISRLGAFPGNTVPTKVDIPEFTRANNDWSYFVLANEQPENQLGATNQLPPNVHSALQEILGKGYENAGAVFQYFSTRKNGQLREARLWTPTITNRNTERVVALGVYGVRFDLGVSGNFVDGRPALGVRGAKKFP